MGKYDYRESYSGKYYPRFVKLHECILDNIDREINQTDDKVDLYYYENGKKLKFGGTYLPISYNSPMNIDEYLLYSFEDYQPYKVKCFLGCFYAGLLCV